MIKLSDESKEILKQGESYLKKNDVNGFLNSLFPRDDCWDEICVLLYETGMMKYMTYIPRFFFASNEMPAQVTIPGNIKTFDPHAFAESKVSSIIIEDGCTDILKGCFADSSIESIKLPNTLKSIGERAFQNCDNLKEIFIPDSVQLLGAGAFDGCDTIKIYITPMSKRGNKLRFKKSDYEFLKDHVVGIETGEGE